MSIRVISFLVQAIAVWLATAAWASAAVNPDQYLTAGRAVDRELVFSTLEPAGTFELAQAFAAREQWINYLDVLDVLARQAEDAGDASWKSRARGELEGFQGNMEAFCDDVLDKAGAYDSGSLDKALVTVELLKAPVLGLDLEQRKWADQAVDLEARWQFLLNALQELGIDQWRSRKDKAAEVAAQVGRSKGQVCAAADLAEARGAFQRMSGLMDGLGGLGLELDRWQWTASSLDYSGLGERTDQLTQDAGQMVNGASALADTIMETKADVALSRARDFLSTIPDAALGSRNTAALNQALYWHERAGSILAAHWNGVDSRAQWRDALRAELAGYSGLPEYEARVRSALRLPDGRSLDDVTRVVLAYRPEPQLERVVLARAMVQAWKQDVDQLAVSYGNARADLAEARDCLSGAAQPWTPEPEPDESVSQDADNVADMDAGTVNATLDAAGDSDAPDEFSDIPDSSDVNVAEDEPQGSPDSESVADAAWLAGWDDQAEVSIRTGLGITSTGYHVFAAGSHLGWASGLAQYSVGPADATIVEHLDLAGDHVYAAYENSRAPLLAWKNHAAIRADLGAARPKAFG